MLEMANACEFGTSSARIFLIIDFDSFSKAPTLQLSHLCGSKLLSGTIDY
jgi:hypothetical protein